MLSEKGAELSHAVRKAESYEREVIIKLSYRQTGESAKKTKRSGKRRMQESGWWWVVGRVEEGFLMIGVF